METPLTQYVSPDGAQRQVKSYERNGGYQVVNKVLKHMTPEAVIAEVKASNLLGRGGAGFPTATKWEFVYGKGGEAFRYLVCNADEMEPGTFKDRLLMEDNPHQLIVGIILAAFAIQANHAYIFLRWAYKKAEKILQLALAEAYESGYLGRNILGSGFDLDIYLHSSAGRYMCGEETGLLNSLEGRRSIARSKPPYPAISGLFGKPTLVNNVETLSCVPHILEKGASWFKSISRSSEGGTKLYGISGHVNHPGIWELPMGITLREILEEYAGGMQKGYTFRAAQPGGASTDFILEDHIDTPLDFASLIPVGSRLGTGTIVVLDDQTCPVAYIHNLERFFAKESCGWCTPCREGLPWVEKILSGIEQGNGSERDLEILQFHTWYCSPGHTFCAHAPGAMEPLQSGLKYFRNDFLQHIHDKHCKWKA